MIWCNICKGQLCCDCGVCIEIGDDYTDECSYDIEESCFEEEIETFD